jgi:hypothetical protein
MVIGLSTAIATNQPLSLSPNHWPLKLAMDGSLKPKAQNFGFAFVPCHAQIWPCAAIKLYNISLS